MMRAFIFMLLVAACTPQPSALPEDFDATFAF